MFYRGVFKLHLRDSSETFCDLPRTSLCLRSYITTGMTLSRPWDNLRLWLWPGGPFRGHDVEFLALMTMPRCSDKALMPPLLSARQILTSVSLISSTDPAAAWSWKVKASDICFCGTALNGDTAWLCLKPVAGPESDVINLFGQQEPKNPEKGELKVKEAAGCSFVLLAATQTACF